MKKIMKVSLVTASILACAQTSVFAASSIGEAFKNGKVKGQIKSYYFAKSYENNASKDASIWVNGLNLAYKTGDFKGLTFATTMQFSSVTNKDDDSNRYANTMDASGAVASEVYLQYKIDKTTLKAGRQFFWTPVVGGSGSRFIRQSFEGYSLSNTNIPGTKIMAAYLTKFADRTDKAGEPGEFGNGRIGVDGASTIYVKNNSIKDLTLQAQYAMASETAKNAKDGHDILYVDGKYNIGKSYVALQYLSTDYEKAGSKSSNAYGVKAGTSISNLSAYIAYTSVADDNSVKQGIGSGSIPLFTNGATVDAWSATLSDTNSYKINVAYKLDASTLALTHSNFDRKDKDTVTETNFTATYKASKNLTAQIQYSMLDNEYIVENKIEKDLRTRLIYSF